MPEQLTMLDEIVWTRGCDGIYRSSIGRIQKLRARVWKVSYPNGLGFCCDSLEYAKTEAVRRLPR